MAVCASINNGCKFIILHIGTSLHLHIHLHICAATAYLCADDLPYFLYRPDSKFYWLYTARQHQSEPDATYY